MTHPAHTSPDTLILCGPTASGKSAVALELAARAGAEIVTVDSMQAYRGMDIGTAKPTPEDRRRIPHHLLDLLEPSEPFDAAAFLRHARAAVADIRARGKRVLLCGGTGLYFQAYLCGLSEAPSADLPLRQALYARPMADLLAELRAKDPAAYERIDRRNPRRVVRALEIIRLTGQPFSSQQTGWQILPEHTRTLRIGLAREPADLRERIHARVDHMFARGLVEETRALLERGLGGNIVALQALGYRQVVEHLRGERNLQDTIALVKTKTRQYARRQHTWFRLQLRPHWIHIPPGTPPAQTAANIRW